MSEAKRAKHGARAGPAPAASTAVPYSVKVTARRALEAAERAHARLQAVNRCDEIDALKDQLDDLDREPHHDHHAEYTLIKHRCEHLQTKHNQRAAQAINTELTFVCAVCFDNCMIGCLRILTPCGHGFCEECTVELRVLRAPADPDPAPACPACRAPVAAVVQPFF